MQDDFDKTYFDATLTPSRSLSPRAFTIVMAIIAGTSFLAGLAFVSMGAFPVIGFFGLDALAIWLAFRLSFRQLRQETHVKVTSKSILLHHKQPGQPPREASIPAAFARIDLVMFDRKPSELRISHGQSAWIIGRFLTPNERKSLKNALEKAILNARSERYA
ncbi:MAG: DUF2244 domain-containing protein [Henriciella sp.]